jgi:hypothetical protein
MKRSTTRVVGARTGAPVETATAAYESMRLEALTQTSVRLRLLRRRLSHQRDFVSRARRQAVDNELLARGVDG